MAGKRLLRLGESGVGHLEVARDLCRVTASDADPLRSAERAPLVSAPPVTPVGSPWGCLSIALLR